MLDEAHMIKSSKSLISLAAAALTADRRWCLTGTPIQVSISLDLIICIIEPIIFILTNTECAFLVFPACISLLVAYAFKFYEFYFNGRTTWRIYTAFSGF